MRRRTLQTLPLVAAAFVALFLSLGASAQSPAPSHQMEDSAPGAGWPTGSGAAVVEGLESLGCSYSQSSIQQQTVSWINAGHWVTTEVSMYNSSGCPGSVSAYENELTGIKNYVEANATSPGNHWAGFMLDEEAGYGLTVAQLESINSYVENMMAGTPGMSWYFTEDFPNGSPADWTASQYNTILGMSWPAPQLYNSYMIGFVNSECSTYGKCVNNLTVNSHFASPWNSPSWVSSQINGTPWSNSYWNSTYYWYNLFQ